MIRKVLILPFFLFFLSTAMGQNLVPNGGFEEVITCPQFLGALDSDCADWFQSIVDPDIEWYLNPSPDWYHECATGEGLSPPNTLVGYQEPFEGVAYAGIVIYAANNPNYREIIGVQLSQPLIVGQVYYMSFRTVLADGQYFDIPSSGLGVKLSHSAIYESSEELINNTSTFHVDSILADTLNWQEISFEFIADEAFTFLHLGNFYDDQHTDTIRIDPPIALQAYYYIDDVRLEQVLGMSNNTKGNKLAVYPIPASVVLNIRSESNMNSISIYSVMGNKVLKREDILQQLCALDIVKLTKGLYIIEVETDSNTIRRRFLKL